MMLEYLKHTTQFVFVNDLRTMFQSIWELWETFKVKFTVPVASVNDSGYWLEDKLQLNRDKASTLLQYLIHCTSYNHYTQTDSFNSY